MYVPADGTGCFRCGPKGWRVTQLITTFLPSGYRYKISVPCFCCCGSSSVTMRRGWLTPKHGRVPESTLHNVQPVTEHPFHSVVTLAKIDHLDPRFICRIPLTPPPQRVQVVGHQRHPHSCAELLQVCKIYEWKFGWRWIQCKKKTKEDAARRAMCIQVVS